jgi:4-oxalocrotonate tautomerase
VPLIHVDLLEGRSAEQHAALIRGLTDATVAALGADPQTVRVVIHEMTPQTYGIGGETFGVVAARRAAERG